MPKFTFKQWDDVADLLEQFASDCETAYEDHDALAKDYLRKRLTRIAMECAEKSATAKLASEIP